MNYIIYCRKSSEEDSKQVQSLETQERLLTDYSEKAKLEVLNILKESKSAKTDGNRPLFTQMLNTISKEKGIGILVAHIDRLSRNEIEGGMLIKLLGAGQLQEIRTPYRTYFNNPSDIFQLGVQFAMDSHYSRNLSVRVKEGIQQKLFRGEYPSKAPIGYVNKDGKIYPDPLRSHYIKQAYELSADSKSLKQITNMLFNKGFRTRGLGKKVHKSVIDRILKDPVYYGAIKRKEIIYKGIHEPIVSQALFNEVQNIIKGKNKSKKLTHNFLYRGYLDCAICGCKLTASIKKGKYKYYYCTNGKGICNQHKDYLDEEDIKKLVVNDFTRFNLDPELADISLDLYISDLRKQYSSGITTKDIIQQQLEQTNKKLSRLVDKFTDGKIPDDLYDQKLKELTNEKTNLELQFKNCKPQNPDITLELMEKFKKELCNLPEMFDSGDDEVRSDLLKSVLWNFSLEDKEIKSERYKLPWHYFKDLHKTDDISIWRRVQDSNL